MRRAELFQQISELFLLRRCQLFADLPLHVLHHLVHLRGVVGPDRVILFLAVGDDFMDGTALFRRELQRIVELLDKLFSQDLRLSLICPAVLRTRLGGRQRAMGNFRVVMLDVIDEQTARHHARAKNHHGSQNDLPGVHCAWSL